MPEGALVALRQLARLFVSCIATTNKKVAIPIGTATFIVVGDTRVALHRSPSWLAVPGRG